MASTPNDTPLLDCELVPIVEKPVKPVTVYLVVAYHSQGWWSIRQNQWLTEERARQAANDMGDCWSHKRILKVSLP